jgi:hypothetical protein
MQTDLLNKRPRQALSRCLKINQVLCEAYRHFDETFLHSAQALADAGVAAPRAST